MENNNEGISIIQLIKVAFGNMKGIVIITAFIVILGLLGCKLFYNPGSQEYVSDFNYFVQELNAGLYIDGSAFNFQEIISYDALEKAKASDTSFENIDIERMYNSNGISITHVKEENVKAEEPKFLYYEIVVKKKYFSDTEQARNFIKYLVSEPIDKTLELSKRGRYKTDINVFDQCESFELQIDYLKAQYEMMDAKYDSLIRYYGDIILSDGESVGDKRKEMNVYFTNNSISTLEYEKEQNGYVLNGKKNIESLKLKKSNLESELKYNELELEKLEKSLSSLMGTVSSELQNADISSYNSRITQLIAENVDLTRSMDIIDAQLKNENNPKNEEYAQKLRDCRDALNGYSDHYFVVEYQVILSESKVFYEKSSVIEGRGGMGLIKGVIIFGILGVFLSCAINLVVGWKDIFKDPFAEEEKKQKKLEKQAAIAGKTRKNR